METFKLVSKITAKHLFNRLKGKSEPIPKAKGDAKKPATSARPAQVVIPEPEPEPEPEVAEPAAAVANPFADSMPFPDSGPADDSGYERMEEVSLEQLLNEGRERPATMTGNIAVPIEVEEVEELGAEEMMPMESTAVATAVMDEPAPASEAGNARIEALEMEILQLQQQLRTAQEQHRTALEALLTDLTDLTVRVREQLG